MEFEAHRIVGQDDQFGGFNVVSPGKLVAFLVERDEGDVHDGGDALYVPDRRGDDIFSGSQSQGPAVTRHTSGARIKESNQWRFHFDRFARRPIERLDIESQLDAKHPQIRRTYRSK